MKGLILALSLMLVAPFGAGPLACGQLLEGEMVGVYGVTCCCRTYDGGVCCNEVSYCGGFVPGCACAY